MVHSYLDEGRPLYTCARCHTHLSYQDSILSKSYHGSTGEAFLVCHVENISVGASERKMLMTGIHTIADVFCSTCHTQLGWKYLRAFEPSQKFKENKFVLEKRRILKETFYA
ncbi:putative fad NAD binding oxidoreductase [Hesseltinella vesiculosa]|uniref:Protein yippee-like n=1 Tax=Hesseltinella vesiculosa TaxID=101127 RepID=A0A1X2GI10_9FUNG|nr:putative fad NAD binding oxidoreductase [Hesseltinella vesiculosa]